MKKTARKVKSRRKTAARKARVKDLPVKGAAKVKAGTLAPTTPIREWIMVPSASGHEKWIELNSVKNV